MDRLYPVFFRQSFYKYGGIILQTCLKIVYFFIAGMLLSLNCFGRHYPKGGISLTGVVQPVVWGHG